MQVSTPLTACVLLIRRAGFESLGAHAVMRTRRTRSSAFGVGRPTRSHSIRFTKTSPAHDTLKALDTRSSDPRVTPAAPPATSRLMSVPTPLVSGPVDRCTSDASRFESFT